jgi:UDP-N-acetylmuramate--alanine ligase
MALAADFGAALAEADVIGVLDVYPAREAPVGELAGVSGLMVAEAAADRAGGRPVWWLRDPESAVATVRSRLREDDVVLALGAGDVGERFAWPLVESDP